jgi:predicted phosphohydrolase
MQGDSGLHLIVAVEGQMRVKREGWSEYAPALFGMPLRYGDLLRLEGASRAIVACADLTVATVQSSISGIPCKTAAKPVFVYGGSLVVTTRGDTSGEFPIVISPRKTKVLIARPTLRWTHVAGTTTYKVSVRGPNVNWSADVGSKTQIAYPDNAPELAAGATYKVTVITGSRSSDEESAPGLGFTILKPDEAQVVREAESKIYALGLKEEPTRFLIAALYAVQGLNAEAIGQLEELSNTLKEPAVVRSLGDLHLRIGLNRFAEERYLQALDLSQGLNDIEGQALAQNALGLVYEALGNKGEAIKRLQWALGIYQKLGDAKMVKQIQERLGELQKP